MKALRRRPIQRAAAGLGVVAVMGVAGSAAPSDAPGAPAATDERTSRARRGPLEVREEWLLAQPRLTLPAASPDPLQAGETRLRIHVNSGNDFGWSQDRPGERPRDRRFLVDGEHRTLEVGLRHGLSAGFDLGLRVPIRWRGGGWMDDVIDGFHRVTRPLGLPENERFSFEANRFRIEGRDERFRSLAWSGGGIGLGNVELEAHGSLRRASDPRGWSAALVGRVGLPTGTGPFRTGGLDWGAQVVAARGLAQTLDVYLGAGGTAFGRTRLRGIEYSRLRGHGFVAVEWRPAGAVSLVVEANVASRLVRNLARYPGIQAYLNVSARLDLGSRTTLEAGFQENIAHQQATTDFGVFLGLARRF